MGSGMKRTLNRIVCAIFAFTLVLWAAGELRAEPASARLVWDYVDPTGITFIGYQDGVEVCRVTELLECPLTIEPGAYTFTVQADNGLWQSDMSAPFLSPEAPSAPLDVTVAVP